MLPLQPNPETGFLETHSSNAFSSDQKVKFLEIAQQLVDKGASPSIGAICKAIGVRTRTLWEHLSLDEKFNDAWQEILNQCESMLVDTMFVNGQRPSGYMDRITWLRAHRPGRWNPDFKVTVSADSSHAKGILGGISQVFEGEIVDKSGDTQAQPQINPAITQQSNENPSVSTQ